MTRHRSTEPGATRGRRLGIAAKLGLVMGAMTVITALVAGVLFAQLRQVITTYDGILGSEVHSALQARQMQVEFKKQVQEWKDILLRGSDPKDLATYTTQFHDESATVDRLGQDLLATSPDAAVRGEVTQFLTEHATLDDGAEGKLAATLFLAPQRSRSAEMANADPALRALVEQSLARVRGPRGFLNRG